MKKNIVPMQLNEVAPRRVPTPRLRVRTQTQVGISGWCGLICNNGTPAQREWCYQKNNCK